MWRLSQGLGCFRPPLPIDVGALVVPCARSACLNEISAHPRVFSAAREAFSSEMLFAFL